MNVSILDQRCYIIKFFDYVTTTDTMWTAKQLCEYAEQGIVRFDNVVQRNYVWKKKQKSLLIHSLIVNYMPPEFLANKKDGIYDMIDGKQRYNAISSFINNEFKLANVPDLVDNGGNIYVLNDKFFKDLDEEIQDKITGRSLKISVMDNASQDVIKEYFFRRNNGTVLTAARKTFSQAKSFDEIGEMARHPLFELMFSKKSKDGDDSKGIVMRSYVILYCENKSLENKKVFPYIQRTTFTEDGIRTITNCYDTLVEVYTIIKDRNEKSNKKIMKRMMTKTHTITLIPIVKYVNENSIDLNVFADWLCRFFSSAEGATISKTYNENATTGSSKVGAVEARIEAMTEDFMEFIKEK